MYKELVEYLTKSLVMFPEDISVMENEVEDRLVIKVTANQEDMGRLIGKDGRIIKAIRSIVRAKAQKENKKVSVDIVDKKKED
ncbi:MAG: KH domain-containing protein [Clostridia bacterium]